MSAARPPARAWQRAAAAVAVGALGAQLGPAHWAGDLLALATDTLLWLAIMLALACAWQRAWRWAALALAAAIVCGAQIASPPLAPIGPAAGDGRQLRLLMYNLYYRNASLDAAIAEIRRHDADVVFLLEYSDAIQAQVEAEFDDYPYRLIRPSRMTMGLALFSRIPIESSVVHRDDRTRIPVFEARLRAGDVPFTFVGGHPWPPQPQWGQLHRDQSEAIARVAEAAAGPLIVAGDFNAAPWAHTVRSLAERAEVRLVRSPLDLTKTWYALPLVGLPIDHLLVSQEWGVLRYSYGEPSGSDHTPLIVDLALPAP